MVEDLTALPVAGASLLDEATAAAEAMALSHRAARGGAVFLVDADVLPQTLDVLRTRASRSASRSSCTTSTSRCPTATAFGVLVQYPGASGRVRDLEPIVAAAHARGALVDGRGRPAGADAAAPAGRGGRRHRGRVDPAVRRAAGLRRPARRLHRGPRRARAAAARPAGRRLGRRRRRAGLPAGRCRPASSTSAARRRPATSAPPRCCWRSSPACTRSTTARTACARSRAGCTVAHGCSPPACEPAASTSPTTPIFDTVTVRVPGRADADRRRCARQPGSTCGWSMPTRCRSRATRRPAPSTSCAVWQAFGVGARLPMSIGSTRRSRSTPIPRRLSSGRRRS